jgi:hypothetical protein
MGLRNGFKYNHQKGRLDLYVNGQRVDSWDDSVGRTYYVNNVTGSSSGDGFSWGNAMDEIDTALLASETYRISHATSNKAIRNHIIVQGTETAYAAVDQDANCCDIFGIGHRAHMGGAAGDVMVSGATAAAGMSMTALVTGWDTTLNCGGGLGVNVYNVHFEASGNYYAVDIYDWLLGSFEDCYFMCSGSNSYGGLNASEHFAGSLIRNCHAGGDAGLPAYGFSFTGGVFNQNLIERNWAQARTYGFYTTDYLQGGTVVRENCFYGGTYGIYDNSAETTVLGRAQYLDNVGSSAGTGIQITNVGTSICSRNISNAGGTQTWSGTIS